MKEHEGSTFEDRKGESSQTYKRLALGFDKALAQAVDDFFRTNSLAPMRATPKHNLRPEKCLPSICHVDPQGVKFR